MGKEIRHFDIVAQEVDPKREFYYYIDFKNKIQYGFSRNLAKDIGFDIVKQSLFLAKAIICVLIIIQY